MNTQKSYSGIFVTFASPLLEEAETFEEFEKAVELAALVWNAVLAGVIEEMYADLEGKGVDDVLDWFKVLEHRRRTIFPSERWYAVATTSDGKDEHTVRVEARGEP